MDSTTGTSAEQLTDPADTPDVVADYRDADFEYEESTNAFRGLFYATLFSLPIWAVIGLAAWGIHSFLNR